jgi:hypothetical protein
MNSYGKKWPQAKFIPALSMKNQKKPPSFGLPDREFDQD